MNYTLDTNTLPAHVRAGFQGKRVLITGGLGFIGSNLAHALVGLGADVTIVDALLPLYGGNHFNVASIKDNITVVEGDIRDSELMAKLVANQDLIYHLAAQVSYIDSKEQPFLDLDINARGLLTVLEAMRCHAPAATLLFASSRLVYGKILTTPVREDHPTDPLSLYGIHKLVGEKYCRYFSDTFGLHTLSVRIPNPYGPRQQMKHDKYSIVGWFIRQALEGNTIRVFGDGQQERDYLFIDDIVEAFLRLTPVGESGSVYNIGTHERVRFLDMVDAVITTIGRGAKEHVPWPANYEHNETGNYIADTTRVSTLTGWQPQVSLQSGIKKTVDYFERYREHYW